MHKDKRENHDRDSRTTEPQHLFQNISRRADEAITISKNSRDNTIKHGIRKVELERAKTEEVMGSVSLGAAARVRQTEGILRKGGGSPRRPRAQAVCYLVSLGTRP